MEGSGPSFEQAGFSVFTVTGAGRVVDSGTKAVGHYGAGFQYAINPRWAFLVGGAYLPLTGAALDFFGISRRPAPSLNVTGYNVILGFQFTLLPKARVQPYLATGPGMAIQRFRFEGLPSETYFAAAYEGAAGVRVHVLPNVGFRAEFGVSKAFVDYSGLGLRVSVGAFL